MRCIRGVWGEKLITSPLELRQPVSGERGERGVHMGSHMKTYLQSDWENKRPISMSICNEQAAKTGVLELRGLVWNSEGAVVLW